MSETSLTEVIVDHRSNCLIWKGYCSKCCFAGSASSRPQPHLAPRAPWNGRSAEHPPRRAALLQGTAHPVAPPGPGPLLSSCRGAASLSGEATAPVCPHMFSITNPKRSAVTRLLITLFCTPSVKPLGFNSGNFSQSSSTAYSSKGLPFLADWKRGFSHISALQKEKTIVSETSR